MSDVIQATINQSASFFAASVPTDDSVIQAKLVVSGASIVVKAASDGGLQPTPAGITLKNVVALEQATMRLDNLADVVPDSANTAAGSTLVYDPVTDKYIVKLLDIDGGSF